MLKDLGSKNRSYRRYDGTTQISQLQMSRWVDLARMSPSSRNLQPLKYMLINSPNECKKVFECLSWAGYLPEWTPSMEESPTAYVIMLSDKHISSGRSYHDEGIASQSVLLGAVEDGYGGCIIASIDRERLRKAFDIENHLEIALVLALGKPAEQIHVCEVESSDIRYFRDEHAAHFVPKRSLDELIVPNGKNE